MKFSSLNRMLDRPWSQHDSVSWLRELVSHHKPEESLTTNDMLYIAGKIKPIWEILLTLSRKKHIAFLKAYFFESQMPEIDRGEQLCLGGNGEMLILFAEIMERIGAENIELDIKAHSEKDQEKYEFIKTFHNVMVNAITRIDEGIERAQQRSGR